MTRRVPLRRLRRLLIIPAAVAALTSCAMHEGTQGWYNATDGTSTDAGPIAIRNILVVASDEGEATVLASFVNDSDTDELLEVTVGDETVAPGSGPLELPTDGTATIGPDGEARVDLADATASPGRTVEVEFRFESAPQASVTALVIEDDGLYAGAFDTN